VRKEYYFKNALLKIFKFSFRKGLKGQLKVIAQAIKNPSETESFWQIQSLLI